MKKSVVSNGAVAPTTDVNVIAQAVAALIASGSIKLDGGSAAPAPQKPEKAAKADTVWNVLDTIATIPATSGKSAVKVSICENEQGLCIDVRKYVNKKGAEGFEQHTLKGISLELADGVAELDKVISALQKARSKAVSMAEKKAGAK